MHLTTHCTHLLISYPPTRLQHPPCELMASKIRILVILARLVALFVVIV